MRSQCENAFRYRILDHARAGGKAAKISLIGSATGGSSVRSTSPAAVKPCGLA